MSEKRRALVTGATGGLGMALVPALLRAGYRVRAGGRSAEAGRTLTALGAETRLGDLRDRGCAEHLCRNIDVVFHAAALSSLWGDRREFEAVNIGATDRLLAAAQAAGADSFVYVSSPSVYARLSDQLNLTEADPPARRPMNQYARTKGLAEARVRRANRPGFAAAAIRPRAIVGPDDAVLLPRLAALAQRGRVPLIRGGRALIELTDARDVAQALIRADQRREAVAGRAVNISGGRPVAVRELAGRIAEAMRRSVRFRPAPIGAALALATLSEALARLRPGRPEPRLTRYAVATLAYSQTFDLRFARAALGYEPEHDAVATLVEAARRRYGPGRGTGAA